jgi:hypothetical protein
MRWCERLIAATNVAGVLLGLCVVITAGLAPSTVRVKGLSLDIAG